MEKRNKPIKILILGRIPPPVGGVTIHVKRLIKRLEDKNIDFAFHKLDSPVSSIIRVALKHKVIHLHTSNSYFRFLFAFFCFLMNKKLIQTYHSDIRHFRFTKRMLNIISIFFTSFPVVINDASYKIARRINKHSHLISAYIQPVASEILPDEIKHLIDLWRGDYSPIFCTNASSLVFDKNGREVYSGTELIKIFSRLNIKGLIFSDPTGKNQQYWMARNRSLPKNVLFITWKHNFCEVLKLSDCFIRASTTDGDSLSVKEALSFGKPVIASDCVDRPAECILYRTNDSDDLLQKISNYQNLKSTKIDKYDGFKQIIQLYRML